MKKYKKNFKLSTFLVVFLTSFCLWFLFSQYIVKVEQDKLLKNWYAWLNMKNIDEKNNSSFSSIFGKKSYDLSNLSDELDLSEFRWVYRTVKEEYYWIDEIDKQEIVNWMIKWFISSIWDKHSEFMDAEEKDEFNKVLSWDFEWIWAVVEKTEIWVRIERVLKWSPAKKSWLIVWDIITEANGVKLEWFTLYEAVWKIKWPAWTEVLLKVLRKGSVWYLDINIIRAKIVIPSVEDEVFEDWIWYIALNMFWENTWDEFEKALKRMKEKHVIWLIIDLRDNWGWFLQKAVEVLSNFIEEWDVVVQTKYREDFLSRKYTTVNSWDIFSKTLSINWYIEY